MVGGRADEGECSEAMTVSGEERRGEQAEMETERRGEGAMARRRGDGERARGEERRWGGEESKGEESRAEQRVGLGRVRQRV